MIKRKTQNRDLELLRKLPVSRGKVMAAVVLVTVMGLMWVRLLVSNKGKGQAVAAASETSSADNGRVTADTDAAGGLCYIQLPFVQGRHDVLARDFFTTANWKAFKPAKGAVTGETVDDGAEQTMTEADISKIEALIELDGIIDSQNSAKPEAFIAGKIVSVGGTIDVEYNSRLLKMTVTEIHKNHVVLRWEKFNFSVRIPQVD